MNSKKPLSPIRYVGGKTRAIKILDKYIPEDCSELASIFAGGLSFELHLAANRGVKISAYDSFEPLVNFWQCLVENRDLLFRLVRTYHPLSKDKFYFLQKNYDTHNDDFKKAAIFFVLNRCSFSGTIFSGGAGPNHPRFNLASIDRIRDFNVPNFTVDLKDFSESIEKHKNILQYLDPPYMIKSHLYGKKGSTHKGFEHDRLRQSLATVDRWFMSYNDCDEIRKLYEGYKILPVHWTYGMSKNKSSSEILIFSKKYEDFLNKLLD